MSENHVTNKLISGQPRIKTKPFLTWGIIALLWINFAITFIGSTQEHQLYLGYLPMETIIKGHFWALVTSVFVHGMTLHLLANTLFFLPISEALERTIGTIKFLLFFLFSAFITNSIQLIVYNDVVIGVSGIVYAMLGFIWVTRNHYSCLNPHLIKGIFGVFTSLAIGVLLLNFLGIHYQGNLAHITGLLFGIVTGGGVIFLKGKAKKHDDLKSSSES